MVYCSVTKTFFLVLLCVPYSSDLVPHPASIIVAPRETQTYGLEQF